MFRITNHQGFQMRLPNGWTVSVQFGVGHYCSRHWETDYDAPRNTDRWESTTAEIAAWSSRAPTADSSGWYSFGDDNVKGYCTALEVTDFITKVAGFKEAI